VKNLLNRGYHLIKVNGSWDENGDWEFDDYIRYSRWWERSHPADHPINNIHPYTRVKRILLHNIGKSFDTTFSYFCKQVPQYQQHWFLDEFSAKYRYGSEHFYIDEDGNIQAIPNTWFYRRYVEKSSTEVSIISDDYETELRHKETGHKYNDFREVWETKEKTYTRKHPQLGHIITHHYTDKIKLLYLEYYPKLKMVPLHMRYQAQRSDFEDVPIKGWKKTFSSVNDPTYIRHCAERNKRYRLNRKKEKKENAAKEYNFLTKSEMELKELRKMDKYKILAHGFDLVTSFRKDKQQTS